MKHTIQINALATKTRDKYGYGTKEPVDIKNILISDPTCTLVEIPLSDNISGMCIKDNGSTIIAVNTNKSVGRARFTLAHELYHKLIKESRGNICGPNFYDNSSEIEEEADYFASYFLMPYDGLEWYCDTNNVEKWDAIEVIKLSQFYQLSYMAVLKRLQKENRILKTEYDDLSKCNVRRTAREYGFSTQLYMPYAASEAQMVLGEYPRLIEQRFKEGRMKQGLYNELRREIGMDYYSKEEVVEND